MPENRDGLCGYHGGMCHLYPGADGGACIAPGLYALLDGQQGVPRVLTLFSLLMFGVVRYFPQHAVSMWKDPFFSAADVLQPEAL